MRSLTDIQKELRTLEKEMHDTLAELHQDIELLKPKPKMSSDLDMKKLYTSIDAVAQKNPIKNPNIGKNGGVEKVAYLLLLSILIPTEGDSFVAPLTYLTRIARGCGKSVSSEELHRTALEFDMARLEKSLSNISPDLYLPLMLDGIMMICVEGAPSSDSMALLGELGNMLNISEKDMTVVAQLAKAILERSQESFDNIAVTRRYPMLNYAVADIFSTYEYVYHYKDNGITYLDHAIKCVSNWSHVQAGEEILRTGYSWSSNSTYASKSGYIELHTYDVNFKTHNIGEPYIGYIIIHSPFDKEWGK